jgi:hypothetical protein
MARKRQERQASVRGPEKQPGTCLWYDGHLRPLSRTPPTPRACTAPARSAVPRGMLRTEWKHPHGGGGGEGEKSESISHENGSEGITHAGYTLPYPLRKYDTLRLTSEGWDPFFRLLGAVAGQERQHAPLGKRGQGDAVGLGHRLDGTEQGLEVTVPGTRQQGGTASSDSKQRQQAATASSNSGQATRGTYSE